jgi:hypothetical protein
VIGQTPGSVPDTDRGTVVLLDLRGRSPDQAVQDVFELLQDRSEPDLTRTLVLDRTEELLAHGDAYRELLSSRRMQALLCVAVGEPAASDRMLHLPATLGTGGDSCVLWVSDPDGSDCRLSGPGSLAVRSRVDDGSGLSELIDVLRSSEIYSAVIRQVDDVPAGVAGPGLRLTDAGPNAVLIRNALSRAVAEFPDGVPGTVPLTEESWEFLADLRREPHQVREDIGPVLPGGRLDRMSSACRDSLGELDGIVEDLQAPDAFLHGKRNAELLTEAVHQLRTDLGTWHNAVEQLCRPRPLPGTQTHLLQDLGFQPLRRRDRPSIDAAGPFLDSLLRGQERLTEIEEQLLAVHGRLVPTGGRTYHEKLQAACPTTMIDDLRRADGLPTPPTWSAAIGPVAAALAGLGGPVAVSADHALAIGAIPPVGTALLWILLSRMAGSPSVDREAGTSGGSLAVPTLVLGTLLGCLLGLPGTVPAVVGAVAGPLLAVGGAWACWRSRTARLVESLPLAGCRRGAEEIRGLTGRIAKDWQDTDVLTEATDAILRMRAAVRGVKRALAEAGFPQEPLPPKVDTQAVEYWDLVVRVHLAQLVRGVLVNRREVLSSQDPSEHEDAAFTECFEQIKAWEGRILTGAGGRPPVEGTVRRTEHTAAEAVIDVRSDVVRWALTIAGTDPQDEMRQLTQARDLSLLDPAHAHPPVIRFVPELFRPTGKEHDLSEPLVPGHKIEWTSLDLRAGALRLVPVRTGSVVQHWSSGRAPEAGADR